MNSKSSLSQITISLSLIVIFMTGCGSNNEASLSGIKQVNELPVGNNISPLNEDTMIGSLLHIDKEQRNLVLDISEWVNRGKSEAVDIMHSQTIHYDDLTIFQSEEGIMKPDELKKGQSLAVFPASDASVEIHEGAITADRILQLTMTREEKLERILASGDDLHTVVLYEEGKLPPYDEIDFDKHVPEAFAGGIAWIPYTEGLAVDYKEELNIDKLPVILVSDCSDPVFRTHSIEELKQWFQSHHPPETNC
ncbi:hypothetical protein [Marinicrinis lubricantis]|uniref:Uncharacterized protein n=1 Tax=Marinicrinis lubricantis TaxID=2086470 RepID=A0ABW1IV85_9BACL